MQPLSGDYADLSCIASGTPGSPARRDGDCEWQKAPLSGFRLPTSDPENSFNIAERFATMPE
jgi:hypothetical protein